MENPMKATIVSPSELTAHPEWRVFDCSHDMSTPEAGADAYTDAHIPGALHAKMETVLSGRQSGTNGHNPLPDAVDFLNWLGRCGLRNTDQVVVYDRSEGFAAARMWWMLRWVGHEAVAVLDGGLSKWLEAGQPVTNVLPDFVPTIFVGNVDDDMHVDVAYIEAHLDQKNWLIVDARGAQKYAGINETNYVRGGHIPGAKNRPYMDNMDADGRFKPAVDLAEEWAKLLDGVHSSQVIAQCGSGLSACHNILAMKIAGLEGVRLYPGSWSEWCSLPERPIVTGLEG